MTTSLFFDLDGTLTDPRTGITACIQYAMEKLGYAVPTQDDLLWCIGPSLLKSFATLVGEQNASAGLALYRERFADIGWQENQPYAGIEQVLAQLNEAGHRLHIATSKPHVYASQIVDHFGFRPYFTKVYGSELDGTRVAKTDLLKYALNDSQSPARSIMIGDREFDALGARANDMRFVGVTYGFGSEQELTDAGATHMASTTMDLSTILMGLTAQAD